ncbi:hypothetical protein IE53DRAFT_388039 [Violaceomyces palustris]|uniref:Uncharacterized protein n=1 Tax=Violaceomyces palustris TaxID=1673888 RepID=A0ACD0NVC7_9BASI|nr:hypothetical protein IE53DRAFT_388039 [Violaceomyces palustris]
MAENGISIHPPRPYSASIFSADALPYYDREIETQPGLRAKVEKEIASEQKNLAKVEEDRLPPKFELFSHHPYLANELERISKGETSSGERLDTSRYSLPAPEAGLDASEQDWDKALNNSAAQIGHMEIRLRNVELLRKYGANLWRLHNFQQESMLTQHSDAAEAIRDRTNELNKERQKSQTEVGHKLSSLEKRWTELISRGLQLEVANITAEHEIETKTAERDALRKALERMDQDEA